MKKGARPQTTRTSTQQRTAEFSTKNPRHLRILHALLVGPQPRQKIDEVAGAANGPDVVLQLRRRGLEIPCVRVVRQDIDGRVVLPGVYHLTARDRRVILRFLARREQQARAACQVGGKPC